MLLLSSKVVYMESVGESDLSYHMETIIMNGIGYDAKI